MSNENRMKSIICNIQSIIVMYAYYNSQYVILLSYKKRLQCGVSKLCILYISYRATSCHSADKSDLFYIKKCSVVIISISKTYSNRSYLIVSY